MDHVDALLFALLAIGDLFLIAWLRRRRAERKRAERIERCVAGGLIRDLRIHSRPRRTRLFVVSGNQKVAKSQ
jgi:hypothetical protein